MSRFRDDQDRIQLLVFDVIMPGKTGREAYEEIRSLQPDIKALFVSGYSTEVVRGKALIDDQCDFIMKPIAPAHFLRKIRDVLEKQASSSAQ